LKQISTFTRTCSLQQAYAAHLFQTGNVTVCLLNTCAISYELEHITSIDKYTVRRTILVTNDKILASNFR